MLENRKSKSELGLAEEAATFRTCRLLDGFDSNQDFAEVHFYDDIPDAQYSLAKNTKSSAKQQSAIGVL